MNSIVRVLKSLTLSELLKGMSLTGRYFFRRNITVQYPEERAPMSPRFRGKHAQRRYPMVKSAASLVNCVKWFVLHKLSPLRQKSVMMARAVPPVTILIWPNVFFVVSVKRPAPSMRSLRRGSMNILGKIAMTYCSQKRSC